MYTAGSALTSQLSYGQHAAGSGGSVPPQCNDRWLRHHAMNRIRMLAAVGPGKWETLRSGCRARGLHRERVARSQTPATKRSKRTWSCFKHFWFYPTPRRPNIPKGAADRSLKGTPSGGPTDHSHLLTGPVPGCHSSPGAPHPWPDTALNLRCRPSP